MHSIEAFVEKIKQDGVDAGRAQADGLVAQAKAQADEMVAAARKEADKLLAQAKEQAQRQKEKLASETALACRDLVLKLKEDLTALLSGVLKAGVDKAVADEALVRELLKEMVAQYAKLDSAAKGGIELRLSDKMYKSLESWVKGELAAVAGKVRIGARPGLSGSGFEVTVSKGATVEISSSALVDALREMVSPALKELLGPDKA